ncbi:MAG: class B sortase [Oscillospiraceae bacterium]|jgi:sortase B|nr:class B sortase [Oscillospiraceae bacterium]
MRIKNEKHGIKFIRLTVILLLLGASIFGGLKLYEGWNEKRKLDNEKDRLEQYEPEEDDSNRQKIRDLLARYPDVVGWLKIENSVISYPFVQTANNNDYLHKTLDGKTLSAGTLFMDYRNHADFSDFNSVIYGHHMQNGSMFGTLKNFINQKEFWDVHRRGWIYLPYQTLELEFFAVITVHETDQTIYGLIYPDNTSKQNFLSHLEQKANRWRDISVTADDRFVCLSTCATATSPYRYVLIGRVVKK